MGLSGAAPRTGAASRRPTVLSDQPRWMTRIASAASSAPSSYGARQIASMSAAGADSTEREKASTPHRPRSRRRAPRARPRRRRPTRCSADRGRTGPARDSPGRASRRGSPRSCRPPRPPCGRCPDGCGGAPTRSPRRKSSACAAVLTQRGLVAVEHLEGHRDALLVGVVGDRARPRARALDRRRGGRPGRRPEQPVRNAVHLVAAERDGQVDDRSAALPRRPLARRSVGRDIVGAGPDRPRS